MRAYLAELLRARRASPRDDLLTHLGDATVGDEPLAFDEVLAFFQLLLVAGHETTSNLIANAVLSLLEHPGARQRVAADPSLIPGAVEEVLRYRSPVQATFREARRDVAVGGVVIPKGKRVLPSIGAANRDPAKFADAGRFDIARAPNPHLAFGHGPHFCIGAALARLEARVALNELLGKIADMELAEPGWAPREAFHVHGPSRLQVRFVAR